MTPPDSWEELRARNPPAWDEMTTEERDAVDRAENPGRWVRIGPVVTEEPAEETTDMTSSYPPANPWRTLLDVVQVSVNNTGVILDLGDSTAAWLSTGEAAALIDHLTQATAAATRLKHVLPGPPPWRAQRG